MSDVPTARYAHIRPAPFWRKRCGRAAPGSSRTCTRAPGHRGPHVAHSLLRRVVAVWEAQDSRANPPAGRKRRGGKPVGLPSKGSRRPVGLRSKGSTSLTGRMGVLAKFVDEHVEEIALAVFFVAFVWFAIDWLMIILS